MAFFCVHSTLQTLLEWRFGGIFLAKLPQPFCLSGQYKATQNATLDRVNTFLEKISRVKNLCSQLQYCLLVPVLQKSSVEKLHVLYGFSDSIENATRVAFFQ